MVVMWHAMAILLVSLSLWSMSQSVCWAYMLVVTVKGMVVVAGGVIDVVGMKNKVVCWGVNMVTWCQSFNRLRRIAKDT